MSEVIGKISDVTQQLLNWVIKPQVAVVLMLYFVTLIAVQFGPIKGYFSGVYSVFWLTLLIFVEVTGKSSFGEKVTSRLNAFAEFLNNRGSFRSNALVEMPKFALIRVAFGLFLAERSVWVIVYLYPSDWASPLLMSVVMANLIVAVLVTIGMLTQLSLLFSVVVLWQMGDGVMQTSTLGNDIAAMLAFLLMVVNAGAHYSVDGIIRKKHNWLGRLVSFTYYRSGLPQDNVLQIGKFLALLAYWSVCVYSLMMHLNEPAWMNGTAGPLLLTNNFMSSFYSEFEQFFQLGSWAVFLGSMSLWAMMPWYVLLLPCVLIGGIWRAYAIIWGLLFFAISLFVLNLGWLAEFEFLFFAALFWQSTFISHKKSLNVAYDDRCNLCDRTINVIRFLDIFGRVELKPVSKNHDWLREMDIDPTRALSDLYGVETNADNRTTYGYDFYITLTRNIFLLLPAYPFLLIGKWIGIGPMIYRYIADRRTTLFGVCEVPTQKPDVTIKKSDAGDLIQIRQSNVIVPITTHFVFLTFVYFLFMPIPYLGWSGTPVPNSFKQIKRYSTGAAHVYGIAPINVFNKTDLRMSENWFTIVNIDKSGEELLLPIFNTDGSRLSMHKSDRVYFGYTLRFRRKYIGKQGCHFDKELGFLKRFARYYRNHLEAGTNSSNKFVYKQYRQLIPNDSEIVLGWFKPNKIEVTCSMPFKL